MECFARLPIWIGTAAGNRYISDRYIDSRIAKVDNKGNWIKSWGEPGASLGSSTLPHSIAVDAEDHVYVADRGNRRIQVFDQRRESSCGRS